VGLRGIAGFVAGTGRFEDASAGVLLTGVQLMSRHGHAAATTRHGDRTLSRDVHLDWSGYRRLSDGYLLLAAHNRRDETLHIDTVSEMVEIPAAYWAVVGDDGRSRTCGDGVFRLTYEPTEESE